MSRHTLDRSESPSCWSTESSEPDDGDDEHRWSSFEMRTLFCMIINGQHKNSESGGPADPVDFADKLNKANNPGRASSMTAETFFSRDIPVNDVQRMLRRVLVKKIHAIDMINHNPARVVTRRQLKSFTRQLDLHGDEDEYSTNQRCNGKFAAICAAERAELESQLDKRTQGRPVSRERQELARELLREIKSPRAHKLLTDWSMGHSFFQGAAFLDRGRWTETDRHFVL